MRDTRPPTPHRHQNDPRPNPDRRGVLSRLALFQEAEKSHTEVITRYQGAAASPLTEAAELVTTLDLSPS